MQTEHDIEKYNRENFRSCLEALARPGTRQPLTPLFDSGIMAMASVLLYAEVSHYYDGTRDFELIRALCGSPRQPAHSADYIFLDNPTCCHCGEFKRGTPENPEEGATVVCCLPAADNNEITLRLSGPGIRDSLGVRLPIDRSFIASFSASNSSFPMGLDLFLIDEKHSVIGIPRTTAIEVVS